MIEIIIPVLNEEAFLRDLDGYFQRLRRHARIIFVDGGSMDRTLEIAGEYGEVYSSLKGRAVQKNTGAGKASSNHLLFLHVDSMIDIPALEAIEDELQKGSVAGCLTMSIDHGGFVFRVFEKVINGRAKYWGIFDGDLGQFVRRDIFEKVGGYDNVPVMEDVLFSRKIRREGLIKMLPNKICVSARKWHQYGFWNLMGQYAGNYLKLWTGRVQIQRTAS